MIYGIGTDIVEIKRIAAVYNKRPKQFVNKILSSIELEDFNKVVKEKKKISYLVNRWIAKEAVVKALGTGFRKGFYLSEITIINDEMGKPIVKLSESTRKNLVEMLNYSQLKTEIVIHLSLSHEISYATSMVVIELI